MPQLLSFRKWWENEHLAKYILSRFCFIAEPSTIWDDIGADLFCTIFSVIKKDDKEYGFPQKSFVIQIKSNLEDIDIKDNQYFVKLELPYFVGVVKDNSLIVYSWEAITHLFHLKWADCNVKIKLVDELEEGKLFDELSDNKFVLYFKRIAEFNLDKSRLEQEDNITLLSNYAHIMQQNISSVTNNEYILLWIDGFCTILSWPESFQHFRDNFWLRLAEVFQNLKRWKQKFEDKKAELEEEEKFYQWIYEQLESFYEDREIIDMTKKEIDWEHRYVWYKRKWWLQEYVKIYCKS